MAIRNVYYTEVIINGETSESLGPSACLTDKEIVSAGTRKAREVIKTLDKKAINNVMVRLCKESVSNEATYTIEAVKYPSKRGVEILVHDNISGEIAPNTIPTSLN